MKINTLSGIITRRKVTYTFIYELACDNWPPCIGVRWT